MITQYQIISRINMRLNKAEEAQAFHKRHLTQLFDKLRQTNSLFKKRKFRDTSFDNSKNLRPKTALRPDSCKAKNKVELIRNHKMISEHCNLLSSTIRDEYKSWHNDSATRRNFRKVGNSFIVADQCIFAKCVSKPKSKAVPYERPKTQAHTKIGNYFSAEPRPVDMNEPSLSTINKLYTKYTSNKRDSKLIAYIKANNKLKINKMYKGSQPYPTKIKKGKSFMEHLVASPVNLTRFTLKEVPTFEIVKQMKISEINQLTSLDLGSAAKAKRPAMSDSSFKQLEDFIVEAEKFKKEIKPLLDQPCIYNGRYDDDFYRGNFDRDSREGFGVLVSFTKGYVYKGEFKNDQIKGLGICALKNGMIIEGYFNGEETVMNDTDVKCLYCNGEIYDGRWRYNKRHGKGKHIYNDLTIYDGDWANDKRNGAGKLINPDGSFIHGDFKKDRLMNGTKFVDVNRNIYEPLNSGSTPGHFVNGRLFGRGKITFVNGDTYEGDFKDGKRCGQGKMQFKNIRKFNDFNEGHASEIDLDWAIYEGKWNDNCRHGYGTMKWSDDSLYKGEWRKDQRYYGTMVMVTGVEYTGYWKNDCFNGKGKLKFADGYIYEGNFINGHREKYGTILSPDGVVYKGEIDGMSRQGYGRLEESGNVYEGNFDDNRKNGKGKMYYKNGDYYNGEWLDDRKEGHGTMYYHESKELFEGEFMGDTRCGYGKLSLADGQTIESQWRNNKAQGEGKLTQEYSYS